MKIGANLGPCADWAAILKAAQTADTCGYDAVSLLDHYHANKPEWAYICGWSLYGALAMTTSQIRLVPMVIDCLNYLPGVLAREVSSLSIISGDRFELGIGAGDYFEEAQAWGTPVPDAPSRIAGLKETIAVLRQSWTGEHITFHGEHLHLTNALATPIPLHPPRIVVGAGKSRRLIRSAVAYADEINVYANDDIIRFAQAEILTAQRPVSLSVYTWDWPEKIEDKIPQWEQMGVERTFLTFWSPFSDIEQKFALLA